jgi:hypothetical protein
VLVGDLSGSYSIPLRVFTYSATVGATQGLSGDSEDSATRSPIVTRGRRPRQANRCREGLTADERPARRTFSGHHLVTVDPQRGARIRSDSGPSGGPHVLPGRHALGPPWARVAREQKAAWG